MQRGRRIAFDYGDVRIGVAICDPDAILSTPLATLQAQSKDLFVQIMQIIDEHEPIHIYIGKPTLLNGNEGAAVSKVEVFVEKLREKSAIPISMVDERLSTVSAMKDMRSAGVNARDAKSSIDAMAAVAILEQGLAIDRSKKI
jgi:putative Holliday junction resolvase